MSTVLVSCFGIHFLCFLLIIQMFHSILSKKVHLMAFHIWKTSSFSLHFPVGNGVVHQQRMIWDLKLLDFLLCLLYYCHNSPLGFCSDVWNRFRANLYVHGFLLTNPCNHYKQWPTWNWSCSAAWCFSHRARQGMSASPGDFPKLPVLTICSSLFLICSLLHSWFVW